MLEPLVWATILVCAVSAVYAYQSTRDVFHPAILLSTLCAFMYGYMPLSLLSKEQLFTYVTESQADFCQSIALVGITLLMVGVFSGSALTRQSLEQNSFEYSWRTLRKGGYILGGIGLACWLETIHGAGGFTGAFGQADGGGWSDVGYIRDGVFMLVVGLILLLTPQVFEHRDRKWLLAVICFTVPWLIQGLLGARRGPTFVIAATLGMSWYLVHRRRPSLPLLVTAGAALGALMLFLVTNRDRIYLGSDFSGLKTDITNVVTDANVSNEYIFGIGCIQTARQTDSYYWGRRYFAEVVVRPIPRQIWPNKYWDVGLGELTRNGGVASFQIMNVMGWRAVAGAAAAMIADLWVEFSWLMFPVLFGIGYAYGYVWKRTVQEGGPWNSLYTIFSVLAIYMVTQSGEAVIFRFLILTAPTAWVWRKARYYAVPDLTEEPLCVS